MRAKLSLHNTIYRRGQGVGGGPTRLLFVPPLHCTLRLHRDSILDGLLGNSANPTRYGTYSITTLSQVLERKRVLPGLLLFNRDVIIASCACQFVIIRSARAITWCTALSPMAARTSCDSESLRSGTSILYASSWRQGTFSISGYPINCQVVRSLYPFNATISLSLPYS